MIVIAIIWGIGFNPMAVAFLVTHKWVQPRRRGFVKMPSQYRAEPMKSSKDIATRWHCVKCGAVKCTVTSNRFSSHPTYFLYFRAWGDIDRKVRSIPPCEGVIPERAPIGA